MSTDRPGTGIRGRMRRGRGIPSPEEADRLFNSRQGEGREVQYVNFSFTGSREPVPWRFGHGRNGSFLNVSVTLADNVADIPAGLVRGRPVCMRCEPGLEDSRAHGLVLRAADLAPLFILYPKEEGLWTYSPSRAGGGVPGWRLDRFGGGMAEALAKCRRAAMTEES